MPHLSCPKAKPTKARKARHQLPVPVPGICTIKQSVYKVCSTKKSAKPELVDEWAFANVGNADYQDGFVRRAGPMESITLLYAPVI
jgi:hypothetical protein